MPAAVWGKVAKIRTPERSGAESFLAPNPLSRTVVGLGTTVVIKAFARRRKGLSMATGGRALTNITTICKSLVFTFGVRKNRGNSVSSSSSPQYVRARHACAKGHV
jgi:hypothetical protein